MDNKILNSVNIVHTGTFNEAGSSLLISAPLPVGKQCLSFEVVERGLQLPHFRKSIVFWNKTSSYACWIAPAYNKMFLGVTTKYYMWYVRKQSGFSLLRFGSLWQIKVVDVWISLAGNISGSFWWNVDTILEEGVISRLQRKIKGRR